jgi:hypothetical protein
MAPSIHPTQQGQSDAHCGLKYQWVILHHVVPAGSSQWGVLPRVSGASSTYSGVTEVSTFHYGHSTTCAA